MLLTGLEVFVFPPEVNHCVFCITDIQKEVISAVITPDYTAKLLTSSLYSNSCHCGVRELLQMADILEIRDVQ